MERKCLRCKTSWTMYDLCAKCMHKLEEQDAKTYLYQHFWNNLSGRIPTVYVLRYKQILKKIGFTMDLESRILELKEQYPSNQLLFFREFATESQARRFEVWLKGRSRRDLHRFVVRFNAKLKLF